MTTSSPPPGAASGRTAKTVSGSVGPIFQSRDSQNNLSLEESLFVRGCLALCFWTREVNISKRRLDSILLSKENLFRVIEIENYKYVLLCSLLES